MKKIFLTVFGLQSNSHQLSRRREFFELDVHHVQKVGIKRFCAQEAEMTLTAISSLESSEKGIFHEHDLIMSRK